MTAKKTPWAKFGRAIHIVVLVAFFFPFFGVSCDGMDVVTASGTDMAFGCKPGGMATMEGDDPDDGAALKVEAVEVEPLAIIALLLAIAAGVLSWLTMRKAILGALVASVLSIGALSGLWVKIAGDMTNQIAEQMKDQDSPMMRDSKIESGTRMGLWLAIGGLAAAAALAGSALKQREEMLESIQPGGPGSSMG